MTDYVKSTNFASKDSLLSGNPLKIVKGAELDTEFNNIATAVATKADSASPTFTGTTTVAALAALGNVSVGGNATVTGNATVSGTASVTGVLSLGANIVFEGATADDYETTFAITDPTADRTITFPDRTGTVAMAADIGTTSISSKTGTYAAASSSTVTVSITSHGLAVGDVVFLDFTSGTAVDNEFTVASVVNANSFTVSYGSTITASGNVTMYNSPLGQIRIASSTEVKIGTNTSKAVTPSTLRSSALVQGTAVNTTSGSSVSFTGIPSWAKRVTILFNDVSRDTNGNFDLVLGTGSTPTYTTSGYNNYSVVFGTSGLGGDVSTTSFEVGYSTQAAYGYSGVITLVNMGSNIWAMQSILGSSTSSSSSNAGVMSGGGVSLSGALTAVKISATGGAFDSGSINIMYE